MRRKKKNNNNKTIIAIALIITVAIWGLQPLLYGNTANDDSTGTRQTSRADTAQGTTTESNNTLDLSHIVSCNTTGCVMLQHTGYVSCFDTETNNPKWVAWELTDDETEGEARRSNYSFTPDELLHSNNQVVTQDYTNSGYDRGHMCPAADMKWSDDAMRECFYMSNICPQVPVLNQQYWERLENACRRWAKREGSIYIVCGPIYDRGASYIGNGHKIRIPDAFFKAIITLTPGAERGIAFYYSNSIDKQTMESALRTIDDIEEISGYDLFAELPDDIEDMVESQKDLRKWN